MLTTAPHLYIRRPSPTTAEFTVTTCPPLTLPLRLLLLALQLLRLALLSAAVLTLYARFFFSATTNPQETTTQLPLPQQQQEQQQQLSQLLIPPLLAGDIPSFLAALLRAAHLSPAGLALAHLASPVPDRAVALLAAAAIYLAVCVQLHTTESVLVLRGLGIQTCSGSGTGTGTGWGAGSSSSKFGGFGGGSGFGLGGWGAQTRFIPTEKIRDVLINEAFRGFEVRYYLVVVVEGEEDVVVLFPGLLPRRKIVEAVWRGVRGCLVEGDGEREGGLSTGLGGKGGS